MLSEEELDRLLIRASLTRPGNPAVLEDESVKDALASVRRGIESRTTWEAQSRSAGTSGYRRRVAAVGVAAAAVGVASLFGVQSLTGGSAGSGLPLAVSPAAAAQIRVFAHTAASQAGPAPGQWAYMEYRNVDSISVKAGSTRVIFNVNATFQAWRAADGAYRSRGDGVALSFATPHDQADYEANKSAIDGQLLRRGWPLPGRSTGVSGDGTNKSGVGKPQPVWVTSPPNSPQMLITEIARGDAAQFSAAPPGKNLSAARAVAQDPDGVWGGLTSLLTASTSPQLRATAFTALQYLPGTKVVGSQTDQLGRSGTAIVFEDHDVTPWETDTLIVDPTTAESLECDITGPSHTFPGGTITIRTIIVREGVVDSATALPGGGSQSFAPGASLTSTSRPLTPTTTSGTSTTPAPSTTSATTTTATANVAPR